MRKFITLLAALSLVAEPACAQSIRNLPAPTTGTGNWVLSTSPALVTPTLGVATATSLAVGGCTLGSNAICLTGLINAASAGSAAAPTLSVGNQTTGLYSVSTTGFGIAVNGVQKADFAITASARWSFVGSVDSDSNLRVNGGGDFFANSAGTVLKNTGVYAFSSTSSATNTADMILSRAAAASLQLGAADVDTNAAIVAQTIRTQGALAGGTSDQAGKNWTFIASPGKGTGAGGSFIFQTTPAGSTGTVVGTPTTALTLDSAQKASFGGQVVVANMTQTSAAQSGTVCFAAAGLTYDASLGCLASLPELKDFHGPITGALATLRKITPYWASWKQGTPEYKGGDHATQPVFNAREVEKVDARLTANGPDGELRGVRYMEMTAFLTAAIKEQQGQIDALKAANTDLAARLDRLEAASAKITPTASNDDVETDERGWTRRKGTCNWTSPDGRSVTLMGCTGAAYFVTTK